jgi:ribosome-binding protein aMBF1 (putative translation factor)
MHSVTAKTASRWVGQLYDEIGQAGFSVEGFARRMGVHRTTLWRIDRGQIQPTEDWSARAEALLMVPAKETAAA